MKINVNSCQAMRVLQRSTRAQHARRDTAHSLGWPQVMFALHNVQQLILKG